MDSLKNPQVRQRLHDLAQAGGVDVVLNATAFALGLEDGQTLAGDAVVLQLVTAGVTRQQWEDDPHGLPPRDMAMQVVLPELDGRIATRAISFKAVQRHGLLRIKGFVALPQAALRLVVQGVGPRLDSHFDRPWRTDEPRRSVLVCIGQGLDEAALRADLRQARLLAACAA